MNTDLTSVADSDWAALPIEVGEPLKKNGYVIIKESEIPAPPTWMTYGLTAIGIESFDAVMQIRDGIKYYSPYVPCWVACIYDIAKCRLPKPLITKRSFFALLTEIVDRPELHDAIVAAADAGFVRQLLKQQGLLQD